jgi:hypothetical protein
VDHLGCEFKTLQAPSKKPLHGEMVRQLSLPQSQGVHKIVIIDLSEGQTAYILGGGFWGTCMIVQGSHQSCARTSQA